MRAPLLYHASRFFLFHARHAWRTLDFIPVIRFFLLLLVLVFPASAWATCVAGLTHTVTRDAYTCLANGSEGSCVSLVESAPFTPTIDYYGCVATYSSLVGCHSDVGAVVPYPITCTEIFTETGQSSTPAPPEEVKQCPDGSSIPVSHLCPGEMPQPSPDTSGYTNELLGQILGAVSQLTSKSSEVINNLAAASNDITTAIQNQTSTLSQAVTASGASVTAGVASLKASTEFLLNGIQTSLTVIDGSIRQAASDLVFNINSNFDRAINEFALKSDQIRSAVNTGSMVVRAAVDESALNIVNAINNGQQIANDYYADSLASLENLSTAVAQNTSAIGQLPGAIANAIATNEAIQGLMAIPGALNQLGTSFTDSIGSAVTALSDSLDAGFDSLNTSLMDIFTSIDTLTNKASDFFAGTETPYSLQGAAELSQQTANPLASSDEVDISTIIKTNPGGGGSCPAPSTADVLGQQITFNYDQICEWAQIVGKLVLIIAAFASIRVFAGGA